MTYGGVSIERLGPTDLQRARRVFAVMDEVFDVGAEPLSDAYLTALLDHDAFWVLGAFDGREAVGGITAHELPMTRHERSELFIYDLAVREDRQRRGIGRRLALALVALAAEQGIDVVFVAADDEDGHALAFYEAIGGRPAPVTMFDLGSR